MEMLKIETDIRNNLKTYCGNKDYNTWFRNSKFELSEVNCKILLPSEFACKWIIKKYYTKIKNILNQYNIHSVNFTSIENMNNIVNTNHQIKEQNINNISSAKQFNDSSLILANKKEYTKSFDKNNTVKPVLLYRNTRLIPQYTFDTFVVGKPNEFAYAAAKSLASSKKTLSSLNPLFLYGGVGLGKTHLMHSIGWYTQQKYPNKKVIYMSAEKFMYEFVKALKIKGMLAFKEHFRSVDILLIDDIQFICGKENTQDEFFHTFNTLINNNKYLVISCDRVPSNLDNIEARIKSRLSGGVTAALYHSTYELRLSILHKKLSVLNITLPKDVIEYLAYNITSNIRELEGALNQVIAHMQLINKSIDLENTKEILFDYLNNASNGIITINDIQKIVSEYYDVSMKDLSSSKRLKNIVKARQICMYLSRQFTSASLIEIARIFNKKDHTTVLHAINTVSKCMKEMIVKNEIQQIIKKIKTVK